MVGRNIKEFNRGLWLIKLCQKGRYAQAFGYLLSTKGKYVNAQDDNGNTPLHVVLSAVQPDRIKKTVRGTGIVVQHPLTHHQQVNIGLYQGYLKLIKALILSNAKLDIPNKEGKRPIDLIQSPEVLKVVEISRVMQSKRQCDLQDRPRSS